MMKKLDKLLAVLLTACVTATIAASSAYALNQNTAPRETPQTTVTDPIPTDPNTTSGVSTEPSNGSSEVSSDEGSSESSEGSSGGDSSGDQDADDGGGGGQDAGGDGGGGQDAGGDGDGGQDAGGDGGGGQGAGGGGGGGQGAGGGGGQDGNSQKPPKKSDQETSTSTREEPRPRSSSHTLSEVNSYDWNQLLSNIDSDGSTVSATSENGGGFLNNNQRKNLGGSWLLFAGIALIIVALGGIGFVIFTQIRARKVNTILSEDNDPSAGAPLDATSDTVSFDPISGDYGDDYDYDNRDTSGGVSQPTDGYDQTPKESTSTQEINDPYEEELGYPAETGYAKREPLEESLLKEDSNSSLYSEEPTSETTAASTDLPTWDEPDISSFSEQPEEIYSDSSLQNQNRAVSSNLENPEAAPEEESFSQTAQNQDVLDLQSSSQGEPLGNQSSAQNPDQKDDFWDKFFRS